MNNIVLRRISQPQTNQENIDLKEARQNCIYPDNVKDSETTVAIATNQLGSHLNDSSFFLRLTRNSVT